MIMTAKKIIGSKAVILFLKNAHKGHAKTRLAKGIGVDKAHEAYLHLLDRTRQLCSDLPYHIYLYYNQEILIDSAWEFDQVNRRIQAEGDLGMKMKSAFAEVLEHVDSAVIIGSDCPYITPSHIADAFQVLEDNDVVYGPALDGGYYLLGMNELQSTLFEGIAWSTEKVLAQSLVKCTASKLEVNTLETLEDIDEVESWKRYLNHVAISPTAQPKNPE